MARIFAARPRYEIKKKKKNGTIVPFPLIADRRFSILSSRGCSLHCIRSEQLFLSWAAICMTIRVLIDVMSRQESPGAGGIRALRCGEENRCQYIRYSGLLIASCARTRVGKEKSCTRQCIRARLRLIAKFSRYHAAFRCAGFSFLHSAPAERTEIQILLRKPRKSRLMTETENLNHRLAALPPIMTENNGEHTYVRTYLRYARLRRAAHTMDTWRAPSRFVPEGETKTMEEAA